MQTTLIAKSINTNAKLKLSIVHKQTNLVYKETIILPTSLTKYGYNYEKTITMFDYNGYNLKSMFDGDDHPGNLSNFYLKISVI